MRAVRIIMWVLLIAAVFVAAAYFLPQKVYVERELEIQANKQIVFNQINDLHHWIKWSKWTMIDPEMEINYFNHGIGESGGYEWKSDNENVGTGRLQIIESVKYDSIVVEMDFMKEGTARSRFKFIETESGTFVNWNLIYDVGYNPLARWMGLMMDKFIGPDFEESLKNLNTVCEVQKEEKTFQIEISRLSEFYYVSLKEKVAPAIISEKMGEMYARITNFIQTRGLETTGMPYSVYDEMGENGIDLECGIPVNKAIESELNFNTGKMESKKCAVLYYFGDYSQLEKGHTEIQQWINRHKYKLAGSPMEIYVTDPGTEPNPDNWQTNIYYPIH